MTVNAYIDYETNEFVVGNKRYSVQRKDWVKLGRVNSIKSHISMKLGGKVPFVDDDLETNPNTAFFTVDGRLVAVYDRESGKTLSVFDADTLVDVNVLNNTNEESAARKLLGKLAEGKELSLDDVRTKLKNSNVWKDYSKVDSQDDYDKFLDKYEEFADDIDSYFVPEELDRTADKLHYYQRQLDLDGLFGA